MLQAPLGPVSKIVTKNMSLFSSLISAFLYWLYFPEGTAHKGAGIRSSKFTSPAKTAFLLVVSAMDLTWLHPCSVIGH